MQACLLWFKIHTSFFFFFFLWVSLLTCCMFSFIFISLHGQPIFYFLCYTAPMWLLWGGLAAFHNEERAHNMVGLEKRKWTKYFSFDFSNTHAYRKDVIFAFWSTTLNHNIRIQKYYYTTGRTEPGRCSNMGLEGYGHSPEEG